MRGGSKSFFAASRVLPQRVRAPASALYAFCRVADDAIDLSESPDAALLATCTPAPGRGVRRHAASGAGRPCAGRVVHDASLPRTLLEALLEGFAWDAEGRRYETIEDLHDYAARVAGTVGAMMALVMETRAPAALARACELGVAMQLTNIARDVGEDARNGRLYLPRAWMREAGLDPDAWLADPVFDATAGRRYRLHVWSTLKSAVKSNVQGTIQSRAGRWCAPNASWR
jgi:phytoene synthase